MDSQYNPKDVEPRIYEFWEQSGYFNPDKLPKRNPKPKPFCIVVPPPNITGSLHMGHALNATVQDILIRKKRMEGYKTLWLPGTDHAGIATQNVVEKELKKQGVSRHDFGREKFLEKVWEWREKYGHIILEQFKKLGSSMDWSRTRFTMDPDYQEAVKEAFSRYYEKGWIYRAKRVVNWCPRCATSLSDLELEYKETDGMLWHIKYPLVEKSQISNLKSQKISKPQSSSHNFIVVATTRPETMLGDTAVAVNPKDDRYKNLVGRKAMLPIQNREIPIIADRSVDMKFGTGAVKVTPAHDITDAEIGARHNLESKEIIDMKSRMTAEAGKICEGLKVSECRAKVVEELKSLGLLVKEEPYRHNVAVCYRCGAIVEPIPSMQWFLKMKDLAAMATKAVKSGKVKFHTKKWENVYLSRLENERDWNISRQLWWGHQLPVFFCRKKQEEFKIKNSKLKINEEYFIVSEKKPEQCVFCKSCEMKQSDDVLDTWFSSALWPFATIGWPIACAQNQNSKIKNQNYCKPLRGSDLEQYYPTAVLSTARDIISIWVAKMVFSGLEFTGKEPFGEVIIHATILTKEGKRMSKSLGTGVDPMELVEKYGADATRFGLIWQAMGGQDIHWSEEHVMAGKKFANKIWNSARYVLLQNPNFKFQIPNKSQILNSKFQTKSDKMIMKQLEKTKKEIDQRIEKYEFGPALHSLYEFYWHVFCDKYIEAAKKQIEDAKLKKSTREILVFVLLKTLKLIHPFMPFITEEIWSRFAEQIEDPRFFGKKSGQTPNEYEKLLIIQSWPDK